jgi:hypothetical protein
MQQFFTSNHSQYWQETGSQKNMMYLGDLVGQDGFVAQLSNRWLFSEVGIASRRSRLQCTGTASGGDATYPTSRSLLDSGWEEQTPQPDGPLARFRRDRTSMDSEAR